MLNRVLILAAVVSAATMTFVEVSRGDENPQQPMQAYTGHGSPAVVGQNAPQAPVSAGNKVCPVSGVEVGQDGMEPATYEYKGKIYNFCCTMCIDEFKSDPEKFIKKVEEELQGVSK